MASALPSPPSSRSTSPDEDSKHDALTQRLDELLEQYLDLLDQYTTLREELSKNFSAGFFSLAQAQRASTLGAGRRYGQECYDDRMKAQRKVTIKHGESRAVSYMVNKSGEQQKPNRQGSQPSQSPVTNPDNKDGEIKEEDIPSADNKSLQSDTLLPRDRAKQDPALRDPLTWFGILAPPALRQTQSHFIKAVEQPIPQLLVANSEMRALEKEITSLREQLGISPSQEEDKSVQDIASEEPVQDRSAETTSKQPPEVSKTARRTNIATRPAHSRSPLLKLGD